MTQRQLVDEHGQRHGISFDRGATFQGPQPRIAREFRIGFVGFSHECEPYHDWMYGSSYTDRITTTVRNGK